MATEVTEQIVREAPAIEELKLGLIRSAQALPQAQLPAYQVAGMSPEQVKALQSGVQGIGAFAPYLQRGAQAMQSGTATMGEAADILRGSDTRKQFDAAQAAYNLAATPAAAIGNLSNVAGSGMGYLAGAGTDIDAAQKMAAAASQADLAASQRLLTGAATQGQQAVEGAGLSMLGGIGTLYDAARQAETASRLGAAPTAQAVQMQGPAPTSFERVGPTAFQAPMMEAARTSFAPDIQAGQMGPPERVAAQQVAASDIQAGQMGPAERIFTQTAAGIGSLEPYMSPYIQNVIDIQKREAQRQADIASNQRAAQAVRAGAFGGSRQAIENAEAARNLAIQMGDIQAAGLQSAFQQAQQQFNTEQQARLAAQQANQQAGLTVGMQNLSAQQQAAVQNQAAQLQASGMSAQQALQAALANQQAGLTVGQQNLASQQAAQQLRAQTGLQTSLANLSSEQQAAVQNQAAQLQALGMNSQQAMQAALANQQAGMGTQQFNAQQQFNTALQNAQMGQQTALANQAMQGQYGIQGAQFGLQAADALRQAGIGSLGAAQNLGALGLQSAQQAGNIGQAMGAQQLQQAGLGQGAAGLYGNLAGQQAGLAGQYAGIAGQQANILGQQSQLQQAIGQGIGNLAAQQFGVGQNLAQGLGSLGTQAANLGVQQTAMGQAAQQMGQQDVNFMFNLGAQQQRQTQAELDALRATKAQEALAPQQRLAFISDIYKSAPSSQMAVTQQQQAAPSPFQQIAGVGTGILGTAAAANAASKLF